MIIPAKYIPNRWLNANFDGIIIGLIVGSLIVFFSFIFSVNNFRFDRAFANIMFSILISLSIANAIYLSTTLLKKNFKHQWAIILAYYGGCMLGMIIGTEVSFIMMWFIFDMPYHFLGHPDQLAFNMAIAVVVCSILFVYEIQKGRFTNRLQTQELEVLKLKQLKTQAELQTLQSKINPHFLYNSLNSIAGLIHEDADKAEDMTLKLSKLFRYSMNSQSENFASVKDEVESVNTYMAIENVRFGDRIKFEICVSDELLEQKMPRFLIQPLVENALKHGLSSKATDGILNVDISPDHGRIILSVADNGQNFPEQLSAGYGLQSTYDKLDLLYHGDYHVQIINHPNKQIKITFPSHA